MTPQEKATMMVQAYVDTHFGDVGETPRQYEVKTVWFCKTLQNWKGLFVTNLIFDPSYYEVTYSGEKRETYIDVYKKVDNVCLRDTDEVQATLEEWKKSRV